MTRPDAADPFLGEELVSILLCLYKIEFEFERNVLHLAGDFILSEPDGVNENIQPCEHKGNVQKLWPLIGHVATRTDWNDTVTLEFDNGKRIQVPPSATGHRGTIHGKFPAPGTLLIEDF